MTLLSSQVPLWYCFISFPLNSSCSRATRMQIEPSSSSRQCKAMMLFSNFRDFVFLQTTIFTLKIQENETRNWSSCWFCLSRVNVNTDIINALWRTKPRPDYSCILKPSLGCFLISRRMVKIPMQIAFMQPTTKQYFLSLYAGIESEVCN